MIPRLAWRNVWRHPRRSGIVITAVAVGLAGVLLAMSINYGMIIGMVEDAIAKELGHLQIQGAGLEDNPGIKIRLPGGARSEAALLEGLSEVAAFAPRIESEGLLNSPRASAGVRILAIDPPRERAITEIDESVVEGDYLDGAGRRILIGEVLSKRLQVGVGDKVVLSAQDLNGDLTGEALRVSGLFRTASRELDSTTVYVRLDEAQRLLALGEDISKLVVVARSRGQVGPLREAVARALGPGAEVRTWEELQPLLVYMVDVFDQMGWAIYGAVFVAMAFGIANVLLMTVYERTRELGILMAIGMKPRRIVAMIVLESALMTVLGSLLGLGAGLLGILLLADGVDVSSVAGGITAYGIDPVIVPALRTQDVVVPLVVAVVTALFSSAWPVVRAVRLRPADAVRHV